MAASVYIATHRKTPVEQAKEDVTVRSSPSSPVPAVRERNASRAKTSRDFLPARMRWDLELQERGYLAAKQGIAEVLAVLAELKTDGDRESFLSGAFRRAADLTVPEALDWARRLSTSANNS